MMQESEFLIHIKYMHIHNMSGRALTTSHRTIAVFTEYRTFLLLLVLAGWMHFCKLFNTFFSEILIAGITIQHKKKNVLKEAFLFLFFYIFLSLMWFK